MPVQLIVNADDFGASEAVNEAVVAARRGGVLTSASLMVTQPHMAEAVTVARQDPDLAVGLHLTLSNGPSLLPPRLIPDLVDESGAFLDSPAQAGFRYYFNPRARQQLRLEIEAQFEAFVQTGLKLSHVDGHQHLHAHPIVAPIAIELAVRHGASGFRIPHDPFLPSLRVNCSGLTRKLAVGLGHAYLQRCCRRSATRSGLATCQHTIGSLMSGQMSADYVIRLLSRFRGTTLEIFFHPSVVDGTEPCGPNRADLDALLDPRLKQFVGERGFLLTDYTGIQREVVSRGLD